MFAWDIALNLLLRNSFSFFIFSFYFFLVPQLIDVSARILSFELLRILIVFIEGSTFMILVRRDRFSNFLSKSYSVFSNILAADLAFLKWD